MVFKGYADTLICSSDGWRGTLPAKESWILSSRIHRLGSRAYLKYGSYAVDFDMVVSKNQSRCGTKCCEWLDPGEAMLPKPRVDEGCLGRTGVNFSCWELVTANEADTVTR